LAHAYRTPEAIAHLLGGRDPEQIRADIQQLAFKIWQTGDWSWTISEKKEDISYPLPAFFFHSLPSPQAEATLPVPNPIPPIPHPNFPITFTHPSLGEFLSAEEIAQKLMRITCQVRDRYGEKSFVLNSAREVAQYLYQYLGYGILSVEMQNLLVERLWREEQKNQANFSFAILFEKLYSFYQGYCYGRWLDERLVSQAHSQLRKLGNPLNLLQFNAAVGLNIFILLCVTSRLASIPFFPCGNPEQPECFDARRLLLFMGQSMVLSHSCFGNRIRDNLTKIQLVSASLPNLVLPQANFKKANLSLAELRNASLSEANFKDADLTWTNLTGANLIKANLNNANLEGADLSGANLLGANLAGAKLKNVCLFAAKLDDANRIFATDSGALFSVEEYEKYLSSLGSGAETEEALENDFPEVKEGVTWTIESVEGEPLLPKSAWDDTSFGTATGGEDNTQALEELMPIDSEEEEDDNNDGATVML
ncbi:MAG: pentapeptide repeat-containing protein, partial [Spirulinaceae cyanobacterium]